MCLLFLPSTADALLLASVDARKEENELAHHTDKYQNKSVVLRRGQRFKIDLHFKEREYMPSKDKVFIEFSVGKLLSPYLFISR